jgi:hypothetical protein
MTAVGVLVTALAACSGGSDEPEPSPECVRLTGISEHLTTAQQNLFEGGPGSATALTRIVDELQRVRRGAPAEVRQSLTGLVSAFQEAELALRTRTPQSAKRLQHAASVLSVEGKQLNDYVLAACSTEGRSPS